MITDAIDIFSDTTRYNLRLYLSNFVDLIKNQQKIVDYYKGSINQGDYKYFEQLNRLLKEIKTIQALFIQNKRQFIDSDFWDLIELVDETETTLLTVYNYPKWFRTSRTNNNFTNQIEIEYVLKQNQSLESLASEIGYSDPDNSWIKMALNNDLKEEDYDDSGGIIFKFSWQNDFKVDIATVVDVMNNDTIYGKDINRKIGFINDDISVLRPKETLNQSVDILLNISKGSIPEFPNDGVDKMLITNLNKNFNIYPSIIRQLYNTFSKDDTLRYISVLNITKQQDLIKIDIQIGTVGDEVINRTI